VRAEALIQELYMIGKTTYCCKKLKVMTSVIYIMLMRQTNGGTKSKQQVAVLLAGNEYGSDKLPL
jgi:hypothetical protein